MVCKQVVTDVVVCRRVVTDVVSWCAEASTRSAKGSRKVSENTEVVSEKVEKLSLGGTGGGDAKLAFNSQLQQAEGNADDKFLPPIAK